jgi:hypothetical protein
MNLRRSLSSQKGKIMQACVEEQEMEGRQE